MTDLTFDLFALHQWETDGGPAFDGGDETAIVDKFGPSQTELSAGAGISPFTKFHFDMTPFQSGIPRNAFYGPVDSPAPADAVLLVFDVERRLSSTGVTVPGICSPTAP